MSSGNERNTFTYEPKDESRILAQLGSVMKVINDRLRAPQEVSDVLQALFSDDTVAGTILRSLGPIVSAMSRDEREKWVKNPQWLIESIHDVLVEPEKHGPYSFEINYALDPFTGKTPAAVKIRDLQSRNVLKTLGTAAEATGTHTVSLWLICFKRPIYSESANAKIQDMGLVSAGWHEFRTYLDRLYKISRYRPVIAANAYCGSRSSSSTGYATMEYPGISAHNHVVPPVEQYNVSWMGSRGNPKALYLARSAEFED